MTTDPSPLSAEYTDARNQFTANSSDQRRGIDDLFAGWQRIKFAAVRCSVDPTEGVAFSDVVEAVLTARISGSPLVWPTAKGK
jgi:hypothetical protein